MKMTESVWVLALGTALSAEYLETKGYGFFMTHDECHRTAARIFWDDMPMNVEAVCIRVESKGAER